MLFDFPLQTICRMIVARGIEEDVAAEEKRIEEDSKTEEEKEKTDEGTVPAASPAEPEIESIWGNEEEEEDKFVPRTSRTFGSRSFSPVWKKDEEPEHSWGSDDDEDSKKVTNKKVESEEEEEEEESDEEDVSEKSIDSVKKK